jgi:hypothetical protein
MMTDKLEDLLYESGLTAQGCWDEFDDYARQGIEKFAELIVRECIAMCENNDFPKNPDLFEHGWDGGLQNAQERMMNHFGIEENKREQIDKAMRAAFKDGVDLSGKKTP